MSEIPEDLRVMCDCDSCKSIRSNLKRAATPDECIVRLEAKVAALEAENGRLKAQVSREEWIGHAESVKASTRVLMLASDGFNAIIAARAQQPSPSQDKPERERINKGQCAAQVVDCDCARCSPAQDKEQP